MSSIILLVVVVLAALGYLYSRGKTLASSPPTGVTITPPSGVSSPPTIGDVQRLVDAFNAKMIPNGLPALVNPVRDATIHRISASTAAIVGYELFHAAERVGLPLVYLLACAFQESCFDPACTNQNLTVTKRTPTFEGTDWGVTQFSGRYLADKPGMVGLTQAQMAVKVLDPKWSIPVFADEMLSLVNWAKTVISTLDDAILASGALPGAKSAYWLATLAYNAGQTEAIKEIHGTGDRPLRAHPNHVKAWSAQISAALGVADPMADA